MGEDVYLSVVLSALVIALAVYGGILAVPPKPGKERSRHHVWAFVAMGLLAFVISGRQAYVNAISQRGLTNSITHVEQQTGKMISETAEVNRLKQIETQHRREVKKQLVKFHARGTFLRNRCSNVAIDADEKKWIADVEQYLKSVSVADADVFMNSSTIVEGSICFQRINARVRLLEEMIAKLPD